MKGQNSHPQGRLVWENAAGARVVRQVGSCPDHRLPMTWRKELAMKITRRYTAEGKDPFAAFPFSPRNSRIVNPDGSVVFEMTDLLAPEHWSQVAIDILAQKYFRRAGVPAQTRRLAEAGVPDWLQRNVPVGTTEGKAQETDARQVFRRLAGCWTYWG